MTIVLTIVTKHPILDVAAVLDPPLLFLPTAYSRQHITKHSILDVAVAPDPPLNKWQNVNRCPYHEHIFMKQNFSGNF